MQQSESQQEVSRSPYRNVIHHAVNRCVYYQDFVLIIAPNRPPYEGLETQVTERTGVLRLVVRISQAQAGATGNFGSGQSSSDGLFSEGIWVVELEVTNRPGAGEWSGTHEIRRDEQQKME
jgi:hypothetical protein